MDAAIMKTQFVKCAFLFCSAKKPDSIANTDNTKLYNRLEKIGTSFSTGFSLYPLFSE